MIPKILHTYWDGSKMTLLNYLTILTFKHHNPTYDIIVWMPSVRQPRQTWTSKYHKTVYTGLDYWPLLKQRSDIRFETVDFDKIGFKNNASEVFKSDFIRWYLLGTHGGVWSDMDIFYTQPLSILADKVTIPKASDHYPIGFFMSCPDNTFFLSMATKAAANHHPRIYQSMGSHLFTQYKTVDDLLKECPPDTVICSHRVYLPFAWNELHAIFRDSHPVPSSSVGIHLFGGSADFVMYCNDPQNYLSDATISRLIREFSDAEPHVKDIMRDLHSSVDVNYHHALL